MSGRQTSIQALFSDSSASGSKTESEQAGIELAIMTSVTIRPIQSYDPHDDLDNESDDASSSEKESELHAMTEGGLEESQELRYGLFRQN